jgi:hypothetical protein
MPLYKKLGDVNPLYHRDNLPLYMQTLVKEYVKMNGNQRTIAMEQPTMCCLHRDGMPLDDILLTIWVKENHNG